MTPFRNGEEVLDEKQEDWNTVASRHQLPNDDQSNEKTESPRTRHALQHPSTERTTNATAGQDKSNELIQTPPEQLPSVPENDRAALDVVDQPVPVSTGEPAPTGKTGPQDQDDGHTFPEGGLRAWLVVLGSFSGMTASFGNLNSAGTFQAYLITHQLAHVSPSAVGWIFSLYAFLTFFCGVQIGPVFDAYGPRWLVFVGSVCLFGGMMLVAESTSKCCLLLCIIPWPFPSSGDWFIPWLTSLSLLRTMAFHPDILRPLRYRLLPHLHPGNRLDSTFLLQTPCCDYRSRQHRRQRRRHHLPIDAPTPLPGSGLQMGHADPRVRLPLPPVRRQSAHPQPPPTIQRQSRRAKHLARLAHLQEPSLRVDDRRGLLYRVGPLHTAILHLVIRSCKGCFAGFQLSTSRHPERGIFPWPLGAGLHG